MVEMKAKKNADPRQLTNTSSKVQNLWRIDPILEKAEKIEVQRVA